MRLDSVMKVAIKLPAEIELANRVKALRVPQSGKIYVDRAGNQVNVKRTDRFNIIFDSSTNIFVRVINGKAVFLQGENKKPLPFKMSLSKVEGSFGENSQGNIFIDSKDSVSKANDSIAIQSRDSYFDETSSRSIALHSENSRFIDAMEDIVVNSPNTGIFLSHNNRVFNSPGVANEMDHAKADELYMRYSNGAKIRDAAILDGRTLIINIDGAVFENSGGAIGLSSEYLNLKNSPLAYAELASGGVTISDSKGAHLENVNSMKGHTVVISDSPGLIAKNSPGINVKGSANADLADAHFADIDSSPRIKIRRSFSVKASGSGGSTVNKSDGAVLKSSPNSIHSTSLESSSIDSPFSAFTNADSGSIQGSKGGSITDSYGASMRDSENGRIYDAEEGSLVRSPGTRLEVSRMTSVQDVVGRAIINRPNEKFDASSANLFPASTTRPKSRPGVSLPTA